VSNYLQAGLTRGERGIQLNGNADEQAASASTAERRDLAPRSNTRHRCQLLKGPAN